MSAPLAVISRLARGDLDLDVLLLQREVVHRHGGLVAPERDVRACAAASIPAHSNATSAPAPLVRSRAAAGTWDLGRVQHMAGVQARGLGLPRCRWLDSDYLTLAGGAATPMP
jgi:hypothetical protein